MHGSSCTRVALMLLGAGFYLTIWAGRTVAQSTEVAGEYVCAEARVANKAVPCTAAPLNLKSDGKFELQGREGEYVVTGNSLELKGTVLKSRAKIEAGHKIVFLFYNKRGICEMIYERRVAELGSTLLGRFVGAPAYLRLRNA